MDEATRTDIADRYRRLAGAFTEKVQAVPADAWDNPSPCPDWTALQVVEHVVGSQGLFRGFVDRPMPDLAPVTADDPLSAWETARDLVQADLDDPERAGAEFDGYFGRTTFATGVDRFLNFDLLVHGWDLAHATGLDDAIDQADIDWLREKTQGFGDAIRGPGAFGPEVEAPDGADDQTRLLAFLGRRA